MHNSNATSKIPQAIGIAVLQVLLAVSCAAVFAVLALAATVPGIIGTTWWHLSPYLVFLCGVYFTISLFYLAVRTFSLVSQYRKLMKALRSYEGTLQIDDITFVLDLKLKKALSNLGAMFARRYFASDVWFDLESGQLLFSDVKAPIRQNGHNKKPAVGAEVSHYGYKVKGCIPVQPLIQFFGVWIFFWTFNGLSSPMGLAVAALLACVFFSISYVATARDKKICPLPVLAEGENGRNRREGAHDKQFQYETADSPADVAENLMNTMLDHLMEIEKIKRKIPDTAIFSKVERILKISEDIVSYVKKRPEKSRQLIQFTDYYLPSTVKLLTEYKELYSRKNLDNISDLLGKTESLMDQICQVFERELNNLYTDKVLDLSVEIDVMEKILSQRTDGISS